MPFNPEPTRTPIGIGTIIVRLKDVPETVVEGETRPAWQAAYFDVQVMLSNGWKTVRHGDLVPYITTAQRNALMSFMAALRTQAESEILPPP